jgi:hypothetical protein
MLTSITRIQSPLNFLLDQVLIVIVVPKYLNFATFSKLQNLHHITITKMGHSPILAFEQAAISPVIERHRRTSVEFSWKFCSKVAQWNSLRK